VRAKNLSGEEFDYRFEANASGPFGDELAAPWLSYDECLREYKRIVRLYQVFGDHARLANLKGGRRLRGILEKLYGSPLPGWYDTHAALL
jgi:hypothetical protein